MMAKKPVKQAKPKGKPSKPVAAKGKKKEVKKNIKPAKVAAKKPAAKKPAAKKKK